MKQIPIKTLEVVWLAVAILALLAGIHKTYNQGFKESYQFYIIFLLSVLMYLNRRYSRKSK